MRGTNQLSASPGTLLIVGETPAARRTCGSLAQSGRVLHLVAPGDDDLARALCETVVSAAILVRDDVAALRYALALAHLDHTLPMLVTIFDRTIADQLRAFLPQVTVVSPASLAVPSLVGPCLDADLLAAHLDGEHLVEVRCESGSPRERISAPPARTPWSRVAAMLRWDHRHHDAGTRLLLIGWLGLAAVLVSDFTWLVVVEHHSLASSFVDAARVVATVGPGPSEVGAVYGVASGVAMLATIVFTAMFTAGLIDRFVEPRLLGLVGVKAAPRRDHVIVVGMGQLGVRLCVELMSMNVPVVGVERDRDAPFLPLARRLGIPVLVGSGTERTILEKLKLQRCRALAAVGSDDLDNISVAVAATAISSSTRVVLRAGEQEAVAETRSLLPLGVIRDVTGIAATFVVAFLLGAKADRVVAGAGSLHLRTATGGYEPAAYSRRENCRHHERAACCDHSPERRPSPDGAQPAMLTR